MKTKIFILGVSILMIATTTTFIGCKKYSDGPWLSVRTKKARLAQSWKNESDPNSTLTFNADGHYTWVYWDSIYHTETGKWDFSNTQIHTKFNIVRGKTGKNGIVLYGGRKGSVTFYPDNFSYFTYVTGESEYSLLIDKLEKKELKLNGDNYKTN
jgi:hypothetical protein